MALSARNDHQETLMCRKPGTSRNEVNGGIHQHHSISFLDERLRLSTISLLAIYSAENTMDSLSVFDFPYALYGPFDPDYHGYDYMRILVDQPVHYDRYCDGLAYHR